MFDKSLHRLALAPFDDLFLPETSCDLSLRRHMQRSMLIFESDNDVDSGVAAAAAAAAPIDPIDVLLVDAVACRKVEEAMLKHYQQALKSECDADEAALNYTAATEKRRAAEAAASQPPLIASPVAPSAAHREPASASQQDDSDSLSPLNQSEALSLFELQRAEAEQALRLDSRGCNGTESTITEQSIGNLNSVRAVAAVLKQHSDADAANKAADVKRSSQFATQQSELRRSQPLPDCASFFNASSPYSQSDAQIAVEFAQHVVLQSIKSDAETSSDALTSEQTDQTSSPGAVASLAPPDLAHADWTQQLSSTVACNQHADQWRHAASHQDSSSRTTDCLDDPLVWIQVSDEGIHICAPHSQVQHLKEVELLYSEFLALPINV